MFAALARPLWSLALTGMMALSAAAAPGQTWQEAVDYANLKSRLGAALPTGAGGAVSLVEASAPNPNNLSVYYIDASGPEFTAAADPVGAALTLVDGSGGAGNGASGHATNIVGFSFFGNTSSMAPAANSVTIYEVGHWWSSVLHYNNGSEPSVQPYRVQNHSWIGTTNSTANDQSVLRRFDYLIETGEMTAVVGANNYNGTATTAIHPNLMVHSYNAIVAGRSDGRHSRGQTTSVYGSGRHRPDLVTPANLTSTSTAQISSAATLLHESGDGGDGVRSETMKAILMAGATKQEFANFVDPVTGGANPWDRTSSRPLDDLFGAGELNIYNSYLIQQGGKQSGASSQPTSAVMNFGWDYQDRKSDSSGTPLYYNFEVAPGSTATELSIILAWNVKVFDQDASPSAFSPMQTLHTLDLRLYNSSVSFKGALLDQSTSTVDNVEHIYQTDLAPGTYTLEVSGLANWDYGLAWRMNTLYDVPSADFDENGAIDGGDFLTWQRNFGRLMGATHADGDADGDGDVDEDDLAIYRTGAASASSGGFAIGSGLPAGGGSLAAAVGAVPEPATLGLAAAGAMLWGVSRLRRRQRRPGA